MLNNNFRAIIRINGIVQGVGFRPFIYRLAKDSGINGWVNNSSKGVKVEAEGTKSQLKKFIKEIKSKKPAISVINNFEVKYTETLGYSSFEIRKSISEGKKEALILPDIATCNECLNDIFDPVNRRYLYPFTNCTNCGPRFSILENLPYDRCNTTMKFFNMCGVCFEEYNNPNDRRFHAQPNACPECGPVLSFCDNQGHIISLGNQALKDTISAIIVGEIVAVKGIGGFQLLTDAYNEKAVLSLRNAKERDEKPFALMFPSLETVKLFCKVSSEEEKLLLSVQSPIVLLKKKGYFEKNNLATTITGKENPYLGIMLPYSPLHHLLMKDLKIPVIATSGNLSDEPLCIDNQDALDSLKNIAGFFLVHNRKIVRQVDDSVSRIISGKHFVIRRARGYAPLPLAFETGKKNIFALGGHLKNTIAFSDKKSIFISQHIGDLNSEKTFITFKKAIKTFKDIYQAETDFVACDLHPDYLSSQYAGSLAKKLFPVQHHYAHILSCMAENKLKGNVFGIAWDGSGLGTDGTIWGGEFFRADEKGFNRFAHFRTFPLPGGEKAVKKPANTALGLLYEVFGKEVFHMESLKCLKAFSINNLKVLEGMLENNINCPPTSSVGRIFDAIASILGLRQNVSFEGQAAMLLEFIAEDNKTKACYNFQILSNEAKKPFIIDWKGMVLEIINDLSNEINPGIIARKFHNSLVDLIISLARIAGEKRIVLSGGCFQNKLLIENTIKALKKNGFQAYWHRLIPTNDGGIALGQIYSALHQIKEV